MWAHLFEVVMKAKKLMSVRIDADLLEKTRDLVYWTPGTTISGIVEQLLFSLIESFERGESIKKRNGNLCRGINKSNNVYYEEAIEPYDD